MPALLEPLGLSNLLTPVATKVASDQAADTSKPPKLDKVDSAWGRFDAAIEQADRDEIYTMAVWMHSALAVGLAAHGYSSNRSVALESGSPGSGSMSTGDGASNVWISIDLYVDLHLRDRRSHATRSSGDLHLRHPDIGQDACSLKEEN